MTRRHAHFPRIGTVACMSTTHVRIHINRGRGRIIAEAAPSAKRQAPFPKVLSFEKLSRPHPPSPNSPSEACPAPKAPRQAPSAKRPFPKSSALKCAASCRALTRLPAPNCRILAFLTFILICSRFSFIDHLFHFKKNKKRQREKHMETRQTDSNGKCQVLCMFISLYLSLSLLK